ncbi:di-heme oxidoreductase, putative peroxidase domain-containing protein [Ditylenchus destructor]|nr:di-heme oxidoreductase, putative peroxidase domain-containing protein [Ditylenchus destructor]
MPFRCRRAARSSTHCAARLPHGGNEDRQHAPVRGAAQPDHPSLQRSAASRHGSGAGGQPAGGPGAGRDVADLAAVGHRLHGQGASLGPVGYLHDGRARTLTEAILWHGGEAEKSRQRFEQLSKMDRDALLAWLKSL